MAKNTRNELTNLYFRGVSEDGSFVFDAHVFPIYSYVSLKLTSYFEGAAEIAIDYLVTPSDVATLIFGLFCEWSNFVNVDSILLNYRNVQLKVTKANGRKDIISMLMKAMSSPEYKAGNNDIIVDTKVYSSDTPFAFQEILYWGKGLCFNRYYPKQRFIISSLKDGIIETYACLGVTIDCFTSSLKDFFNPSYNIYGFKGIKVTFNGFSILVTECNVDRISYLYWRSLNFSSLLYEQEREAYYDSPQYIRDRAKSLKATVRKAAVIDKIKKSANKGIDFSIADGKKLIQWQECKEINSKDDYSNGTIEYAILWAQSMEYMLSKHNKKLSDIWEECSNSADIHGITGSMYGCAVSILSSFWNYGDELRVLHNREYGHDGNGVVNPAILSVSA